MPASSEYRNNGGDKLTVDPRPALLERMPATADPSLGLDELQAKLAIATVIFERHGDAGRQGAWRALTDVIDFLRDQGLPVQTLLPLASIATAMTDLDRNVVSPLLAAQPRPGSPPKSMVDGHFDAFLAVVTECCLRVLRQAGATKYREQAERNAARLVNRSPVGERVDAKRMHEARRMIAAIKPKVKDPKRELFDRLMREAAAAPSIEVWVDHLVQAGWVPFPHVSG